MKRTNNPIIIMSVIILVGIIGATIVSIAENIFGMMNVFMFAVAVTSIVGLIVVPVMQIKDRINRK